MSEEMKSNSMKIISSAGEARSCYVEAIRKAGSGEIDDAEELLQNGKKIFIEGHKAHMMILQEEASNNETSNNNNNISLLLIHAEDQLNSAEVFEILAQEIIEMAKKKHKAKGEENN